jgi:enterochelin esterase-like enzyme
MLLRKNTFWFLWIILFMAGCGARAPHPDVNLGVTSQHSISSLENATASSSNAPASSRLLYQKIYSESLRANISFAIYLPAGYAADKRYPVLYSLYGYGGNHYSLFNGFMSINRTADNMIADGRLIPLIIVVPDYKNSFGVNSTKEQNPNASGGTIGLYEDYLIKELIPYIDQQFNTDKRREGRFIDGYSMGGFAALYLGFNYPELFSKIGAHSSALWNYTAKDMFIGQRNWLYASPELRARRDPFLLAQSQDLRETDIYIDVGSEDDLFEINHIFYQHLLSQSIRVQWQSTSGGHNANYWNANVENYFLFYTAQYINE